MPAETDKRAIQKALVARVPGRDGASPAALRCAALDDALNDGPCARVRIPVLSRALLTQQESAEC